MKKWIYGPAAVAAAAALGAGSAGASSGVGGVTIKAKDTGVTFVANKSITDTMYFSPGTATVKSGATLTFEYDGKPTQEPHTLTIVAKQDLPKTGDQVENCAVCQKLAAAHLAKPTAPPGPLPATAPGPAVSATAGGSAGAVLGQRPSRSHLRSALGGRGGRPERPE